MNNVYLFKIGRFQKDFEYLFSNINVLGYVDDNNEDLNAISLDKFIEIRNNEKLVICDRTNYDTEQLMNKYNLKNEEDYVWFEDLGYLLEDGLFYSNYSKHNNITNSILFKRMIYCESYDDFKCTYPFDYANFQHDGNFHLCCPSYGFNYVGNIGDHDVDELWNSNRAKLIRLSIINKTYAFCYRNKCPYLNKENIKRTNTRFDDIEFSESPNEIYVSIDSSCNLKCKNCRKDFFELNENKRNRLELVKNNLLNSEWLSKSRTLCLAGDGEVFYSKIYQDILNSDEVKCRDSIEILTNGTMMNKEKLDDLVKNYKEISICISIDAANKETYNKIRIGGNYIKLIENLEYLSYLKSKGLITRVELNFVIQRENYKEIVDFIELVKKYKFNCANFSYISNWGTYTDEEFNNISMVKNGIPNEELKEELNKINPSDYKYIPSSSFIKKYFTEKEVL